MARAGARHTAREARAPGVGRQLTEYRRKRDFRVTAEPSGVARLAAGRRLQFVVQKHAASHLHFDFRLEMEGVMKSWAVPKGPSVDPEVRRLAIQVEDHPLEYNAFEGTIPRGQYGGGTVMIWDRGSYEPLDATGDAEEALRREYRLGHLRIVLHGERLRGAWSLVRTAAGNGARPQWLLIKARDADASSRDVVAHETTSVVTGRTMEEIAGGAVHGAGGRAAPRARTRAAPSSAPRRLGPALRPMLATTAAEAPSEAGWVFEPKYDGVRIVAFATPEGAALYTRNGHAKTAQLPEIADALRRLARSRRADLVLDGEVVALDERGRPARFQELQQRLPRGGSRGGSRGTVAGTGRRVAFVAFDLLAHGHDVLLGEPWRERRARLERVFAGPIPGEPGALRISERLAGSARAVLARARRLGWEGVIAKHEDSPYEPGHRSRWWRKLKVEATQELVVGGYTEPRGSRKRFGALLLGYHDAEGRLVYAGHTGTGFSNATLEDMYRRLRPLERQSCPFAEVPKTNEPAHWVRPEVVVEIRFNEWTKSGKLRQPVFVGVREDRDPRTVVREPPSVGAGS